MTSRNFFDSNKGPAMVIALIAFVCGCIVAFGLHSSNQEFTSMIVAAAEKDQESASAPENQIGTGESSTADQKEGESQSAPDQSEDPINNTDDESNNSVMGETDSDGFVTVDKTMYVSGNLNVRASWTADSEKIGMIYGNETAHVIGESANGWSRVDFNGQVGYVSTQYLVEP